MNHSLEFTHRMSNTFLVINLKIKLGESMFETSIYGAYGSNDFPTKEKISKWIYAIENNVSLYDIFLIDDDKSSSIIGLKNNYFYINGFNIPTKLIKNDLLNFLKSIKEIENESPISIEYK